MIAFLLGLLIGLLIGMYLGTVLVIRTVYKDGYAIKDGHVVSKGGEAE